MVSLTASSQQARALNAQNITYGLPIGTGGSDNKISIYQAYVYANQAGFGGEGLANIVAIAMAESGLSTNARNTNHDQWSSVDRGIVQINNHFHPEISDACADDPACAFKQAYKISKGGIDFHEWSSFPSKSNTFKQQVIDTINSGNIPGWCYALGPGAALVPACTTNTAGSPVAPPSVVTEKVGDLTTQGFSQLLTGWLQGVLSQFEGALPAVLERVGLFVFALILVVVGFVMLVHP